MQKELVSVIVPIYNIAPYMDRCVQSIINQTYKELEIILVDDGSTDGCSEKCDDWKKIDKRVIVIHKENGGASDARNAGIERSGGRYICFVDGDDEVSPTMVERLYVEMVTSNASITMCRMEKIEPARRYETRAFPVSSSRMELTGIEATRLLLRDIIDCSPCLRLYRKELFNNLRFPYGITNEDFAILYKLFSNSKRIIYIADILYYYHFRENSVTSSYFSEAQFDKVDNTMEMVRYVKKYLPELMEEAYFYHHLQTMYLLKTLCVMGNYNEYSCRYKQLRKILKAGMFRVFLCEWISFKEKMLYFTLAWMPKLYIKKQRKNRRKNEKRENQRYSSCL